MRRLIAALVVFAVAAIGVSGCGGTSQTQRATTPSTSRQTVLPFTGLEDPHDLAVDAEGTVYVADLHHIKDDKGIGSVTSRVIKLPAGSNTQTVLPQFVHAGLVAGPAGAVWVVDAGKDHLVKLGAGSEIQIVQRLPDLGLRSVVLAMDSTGDAYGTNGGGVNRGGGCCVPVHVVKSAPGLDPPTVLMIITASSLGGGPNGMAVDAAGNVYVGNPTRVLKLEAGADTHTVLPFTQLRGVVDVAVDSAGNVYVVDAEQEQVLKLAAGADAPIVLPFTGLEHPAKVAVDAAGNVYVADVGSHSVIRLAAAQK
jgi:streptogramin lyase